MVDEVKILTELETSVRSALARAEERMSHVQRQLAGWPPFAPSEPAWSQTEEGWDALKEQSETIVQSVDDDLASAQTSLARFLQFGRELQTSLRAK